jgi:hypothetical protein
VNSEVLRHEGESFRDLGYFFKELDRPVLVKSSA